MAVNFHPPIPAIAVANLPMLKLPMLSLILFVLLFPSDF